MASSSFSQEKKVASRLFFLGSFRETILLGQGSPFSLNQPRGDIGLRDLVFAPNVGRDISIPPAQRCLPREGAGNRWMWGYLRPPQRRTWFCLSSFMNRALNFCSSSKPDLLQGKMLFMAGRDRELPRGHPGWWWGWKDV